MPTPTRVLCFTIVLVTGLLVSLCHGQITQPISGIPPLSTYGPSPDNINLTSENLNIHIELPLFSKPGRGGNATNFVLQFDNPTWYVSPSSLYPQYSWTYPNQYVTTEYPWATLYRLPTGGYTAWYNPDSAEYQCPGNTEADGNGPTIRVYSNPEFIDKMGNVHTLYADVRDLSECGIASDHVTASVDGFLFDVYPNNISVTDLSGLSAGHGDGISVGPVAEGTPLPDSPGDVDYTKELRYAWNELEFQDVNGNQITGRVELPRTGPYAGSNAGPWKKTITDTTGASIQVSSNGLDKTSSSYTETLTYTDSNGAQQTVQIQSATYTMQSNFGYPYTIDFSATTVYWVHKLIYPDGTFYQFDYEPTPGYPGSTTGRLQSITLPTGGVISYTYAGAFNGGQGDYILTRTTPDGKTTYDRTPTLVRGGGAVYADVGCPIQSNVQMTITDSQSNVTILDIDDDPNSQFGPVEFRRRIYQGSASPGNLRQTTNTCMDPTTNMSNVTTTNLIAGGLASKTVQTYAPSGLLSKTDEYDFGASTPTRKTIASYATLGNNILDRTLSLSTKDGADNLLSKTTYGYDESDLSTSPGSVQPVAVTGARGNQTSVQRQSDPNGTVIQTATTTYDVAGMPATIMDANGNKVTITYDSTGALPVSVSHDGTLVKDTYSYDANTALLVSHTDPNNQVTSLKYDGSNRLWAVHNPDVSDKSLYSEVWCYGTLSASSVSALSTGLTLPADSSTCSSATGAHQVTQTLDSMGRVTQSQDNSAGTAVDTLYNNLGQVQATSNPRNSGDAPTWTSFLYDVLGRKTTQCQTDNGTSNSSTCQPSTSYISWLYSGNTVTTSDELRNPWTRKYDVFGNLTGVTEPNGATTQYIFSALGELKKVTQNGTSALPPVTRTFSYDMLSRLTCSANPENSLANAVCPNDVGGQIPQGLVSYTYYPNGNLNTKTDARGVSISYSYDALNRLKLKQLANGTILAGYGYDGFSQDGGFKYSWTHNYIGRLSDFSNQVDAATIFSYDPMGRVNGQTEGIPSDLSYTLGVSALYDLAGNLTDLQYPDLTHMTQTFDGAGRVSTVGNGSAVKAYVQSVLYSPDGSAGTTTLGNGITQVTTENSRMQVQGSTVRDPLAGLSGTTYLSRTYCYMVGSNCPTAGAANNGNIWQITDNLNGSRSQAFTYDGLNRISSYTQGAVLQQQYLVDPFGNIGAAAGADYGPRFNTSNQVSGWIQLRATTNPAPPLPLYDFSGNQTGDADANGLLRTLVFDNESRLSQIGVTGGSTSAFFTYGADGSRVRKKNYNGVPPPGATSTEYIYFGGEPIAEKDQSGSWTDYIYAEGKKIARISTANSTNPSNQPTPTVPALHTRGTRNDASVNQACGTAWDVSVTGWNSTTQVGAGDRLIWYQKESNAQGGLTFMLDHSELLIVPDDQGQPYTFTDGDQSGKWHRRSATIDTSYNGESYVGRLLDHAVVTTQNTTGPVDWEQFISDAVIISGKDGSVTPVLTGASVASSLWSACGVAQPYIAEDPVPADIPQMGTRFYLSDHLGSAQMEFDGMGLPVAMSQFTPFGTEINPPAATDHYKFTGKERDIESGLDSFGARYYSSNMGRFMSPDWSDSPVPIPFGDLNDPQSLNLYSYVRNNPISGVDLDGHDLGVSTVAGEMTCDESSSSDACQAKQRPRYPDETVNVVDQAYQVDEAAVQTGRAFQVAQSAAPKDPCANNTLAAAHVNIHNNIRQASKHALVGGALGALAGVTIPGLNFRTGSLFAYAQLVNTNGVQDIKNQPGPGYQNSLGVAAGNISFGVTCPFGAIFCQAAAGAAQTGSAILGKASGGRFGGGTIGPARTFFDSPNDNQQVREGQAMRAQGCLG